MMHQAVAALSPIKLKNASKKIAVGIVNIVLIMMIPKIFGKICLPIIRVSLAPNVREARTNSWFFIFQNLGTYDTGHANPSCKGNRNNYRGYTWFHN